MIHEITDEDGILEDITIESYITVEIVGSVYSGATVPAMENSGHKTKRHNIGGNSDHVHVYHNSPPYHFFNLIMREEFRSSIFQE